METPPLDLTAIARRLDSTPRGYWNASGCTVVAGDREVAATARNPLVAEFIAHAPRDVAALMAEVRRLRQELRAADRVNRRARNVARKATEIRDQALSDIELLQAEMDALTRS